MPHHNLHRRRVTRAIGIAFLLLGSMLRAAAPEATPAKYTPYDLYLGPVFKVLSEVGSDSPELEKVIALMREAHSFEYKMEDPLRPLTPAETARRRAGDCKAKALWLCKEMNDASILYVIGKVSHDSLINHAWLQWRKGDQWYVLDATNSCQPMPAEHLGHQSYIPIYAFSKEGAVRFRPRLMQQHASSAKPLPVSSR